MSRAGWTEIKLKPPDRDGIFGGSESAEGLIWSVPAFEAERHCIRCFLADRCLTVGLGSGKIRMFSAMLNARQTVVQWFGPASGSLQLPSVSYQGHLIFAPDLLGCSNYERMASLYSPTGGINFERSADSPATASTQLSAPTNLSSRLLR